jgi:hypothetical protein
MSLLSFIKKRVLPVKRNPSFLGGMILSETQLNLLYKLYSKKIKRNSLIQTINFSIINSKSIEHPRGYQQKVSPSTEYENRLIKLSKIDSSPKEVLSFKIKYTNESEFEVPQVFFGKFNHVRFNEGEKILNKIIQTKKTKIKEIQITHTHPVYDILVDEKTSITHPLSLDDMLLARNFAKKVPINTTVLLKAIVPNGYFYWIRFKVRRILYFIKVIEIDFS